MAPEERGFVVVGRPRFGAEQQGRIAGDDLLGCLSLGDFERKDFFEHGAGESALAE